MGKTRLAAHAAEMYQELKESEKDLRDAAAVLNKLERIESARVMLLQAGTIKKLLGKITD